MSLYVCENNLIFKHANLILNHSVLTNNYTHKGPSELTSFLGKTFKRNIKLNRHVSSASTETLLALFLCTFIHIRWNMHESSIKKNMIWFCILNIRKCFLPLGDEVTETYLHIQFP